MKIRKLLSIVLILCLFATLAPAAFAEDSTETVYAEPGDELEYGNVTVTDDEYGNAQGVYAYANSEGDTSVTATGNVSATGDYAYGVGAGAEEGTVSVSVGGNVTATGTEYAYAVTTETEGGTASVSVGSNVTATGTNYAYGVYSGTDGGTASVSVGGNVAATGTDFAAGVVSQSGEGGTASASVGGNVTVSGEYAIGVEAMADEGNATVEVAGNVTATASAENDDDPSSMPFNMEAAGAVIFAAEDGTAKLIVGGNVEGSGEGANGVILMSDGSGSTALEVAGNVTGEANGIVLFPMTMGPMGPSAIEDFEEFKADIFVEGTVEGGENSVLAMTPTAEGVTLTVWKAELNEDGKIVGTYDFAKAKESITDEDELVAIEEIEEYEKKFTEAAEEIEKNILYIIKYEDPEGGTINLLGTVKSHGKDAAKEGDTVTLNALVKDGYKLVGAFNGVESKTALMQDANGNYYLVVPKGGGVYLTVKLEKIATETKGEVYNGPAIIGTRQLKGAFLYLYANKTYVMAFNDGKTEKGTWELKDGAFVFTDKDGNTFEPTTNGDGNFEYTYTRKNGTEFKFTLSKTFTARTEKAATKAV